MRPARSRGQVHVKGICHVENSCARALPLHANSLRAARSISTKFQSPPMKPGRNPWDISDPAPLGDRDENAIFNAVGRALTEWEHVESACARLFAVFVSANYRRAYHAPAVQAFGCVTSVKTKGDMLRLAATAYFQKRKTKQAAFQRQFSQAVNEYVAYSNTRNDIAHGCVQRVFLTERAIGIRRRAGGIGCYLVPSFFNPKKFKLDQFTYRYTSSDLIHYTQEFTKLHLRINALREKMQPTRAKARV